MELKSADTSSVQHAPDSSNRTFMELKYAINESIRSAEIVLIVPLWN